MASVGQTVEVESVKSEVGRNEAIAAIDADGGANEHSVDVDDVRLPHGSGFFRNEAELSGPRGPWRTGAGPNSATSQRAGVPGERQRGNAMKWRSVQSWASSYRSHEPRWPS